MACCAPIPKLANTIRRFERPEQRGYRSSYSADPVAGDDEVREEHAYRQIGYNYTAIAGTGSAVTDLIFSIAKREVTFFSGTAPISFL